MKSGKSNIIDCWVIDTKVHRNAKFTIYKVHNENKSSERYLLALSNHQDFLPEDLEDDSFPFLIDCKPEYSYYNKHCFPIIPPSFSSGYYGDRSYFVFEKMNRSLSSVLSDPTVQLSSSDIAIITCQLLDIAGFCFSKNLVFKNLRVNDFFLRKTTRGYRVVIINQNFYSNTPYFIEDPLFTSYSVMSGNEPTALDNLISLAYILYYLQSGSLPWCGLDDNEMKAQKAQMLLNFAYPIQFFNEVFTNPHLNVMQFISQTIYSLRKAFPKAQLTLGKNMQANLKERRVQEQETPSQPAIEEPLKAQPACVVTVSGQQYEMKEVEGKRVMEMVQRGQQEQQEQQTQQAQQEQQEQQEQQTQQTQQTEQTQQASTVRSIKRPSENAPGERTKQVQEKPVVLPSKSQKRNLPEELKKESMRRKRRRTVIQHKSFSLNVKRFLSSSMTSNLLMVAVAALFN